MYKLKDDSFLFLYYTRYLLAKGRKWEKSKRFRGGHTKIFRGGHTKIFRGGHAKITLKVLPHNLSSYLSNQKYTVPKIRCRILFTSALNREVSSLPRRNITAEHFNYKLKTCQHVYGIEKVSFIQKEFDNFLLTVLR